MSAEQRLYRCLECDRTLKGAASLGRHLREQHLLVPLRRGLTFTVPFGLTAKQGRRLTDDDPADAALLAPRRRGVSSDTGEGVRSAKKRKGPSASATVAEKRRLSDVLGLLTGSTLAAVPRPTTLNIFVVRSSAGGEVTLHLPTTPTPITSTFFGRSFKRNRRPRGYPVRQCRPFGNGRSGT